jgi:hypothetical protein
MMEPTPGKVFLDRFREERVSSQDFQDPDQSLAETRDKRWPTRWENRVQGVPSMALASEERRANYM